ncbi:DUF3466 family protein [Photobacterium halotolerans]|uniref:GlyGly-CTERM sorting domain-containing protein n=1 Tax=Photobacterium halotolerans TaxID=265726 RepID=A0A0F5V8W9_9GAMM|nr:DUF3466 family protein [Photobacterium halotolerans]KKC98553.1 hypothetical protein KY46_17475 [Photobacterium halotolerans]
MRHKMFKFSTLAIVVASVTQAQAAVYDVVEVSGDGSGVDALQYYDKNNSDLASQVQFYGQGISPSTGTENCFETSCSSTSYKVFGESRFGSDGIDIRDEIPYQLDNFQQINDEWSLERHCSSAYGFNTCDTWAETRFFGVGYNSDNPEDGSGYGGLRREQFAWQDNYYANTLPLLDNGTDAFERVTTFANAAAGYDSGVTPSLGTLVDGGDHVSANGAISSYGTILIDDPEDTDVPPKQIEVNYALGVTSAAYFANNNRYARQFNKRGFVNLDATKVSLLPSAGNDLVKNMGQTLAWDAVEYPAGNLLVVGSAAFAPSNLNDNIKLPDDVPINRSDLNNCKTKASNPSELFGTDEKSWACQFTVFANEAAFWNVDGSSATSEAQLVAARASDRPALDPDDNNRSFQASARAVSLVDGKPVMVGYTTDSVDNDYYAVRAAIFKLKDGVSGIPTAESWTASYIPNLNIEQGNDRIYRYTIATDINDQNKVIGVAKRAKSTERSYAEMMYLYDATSNSFKWLDSSVSSIFFAGANGYPSAINTHDQIVGWVDAETVNQVNGRQRRQRAFTYLAGSDTVTDALPAKSAWMLDDLTNDDNVNGNANRFRIAQATGINDAGVISATALKCDAGYKSTSKNAECDGDERLVAVKLIPRVDAQVQPRTDDETSVSRKGGSIGLVTLSLMALLGFCRRK